MFILRSSICVRPCFVALALLASACGGDDDKNTAPDDGETDGGAPATVVSYPPALGPEDCATTTSAIKLTQPEGAAVWGGLVVLEFSVEGAKVDAFDIETFDPSLDAWTTIFAGVTGQRDDGSYLLSVTPPFSEANKDGELKLRVRPSQQGCPEADWTETDSFAQGDPLVGTSWQAEIPSYSFSENLTLQRTPIVQQPMFVPSYPVELGDVTVSLAFGKKGAFDEVVTVPLSTEAGAPFDGCKLNLTFSGTYSLIGRRNQLLLAVSDQKLVSIKGTTCELPAVKDLNIAQMDEAIPPMRLNAYTQDVSINYLPTLYTDPGAPTWTFYALNNLFQQLPSFLTYVTDKESGGVSGYANTQDFDLERR